MYTFGFCVHIIMCVYTCTVFPCLTACSIVTDDQYASNVPNNIRPEIPMAMDGGDHTPSSVLSPRQQGSAVSMVTRARGRTDDATTPNQREDGSK